MFYFLLLDQFLFLPGVDEGLSDLNYLFQLLVIGLDL